RNNDWDSALQLVGTNSEQADMRAALCFAAGRFEDVRSIEGGGATTFYFKAICLLRAGDREAAQRCLEAIDSKAPLRVVADRVLGWLALSDAASALRENDVPRARSALLTAANCWPGADGALAGLGSSDDGMLAILVLANHRTKLREALQQQRAQDGALLNPHACHRLAIFHLAEGQALLKSGEHRAAVTEWEAAIGCLAVASANRA